MPGAEAQLSSVRTSVAANPTASAERPPMTDASHAISRNSPLKALHLLTAYSTRLGKSPLDNPQARSRFHHEDYARRRRMLLAR